MDLWAEIVEGVGFCSFLYYIYNTFTCIRHQAPSDHCLKCYQDRSGETGFIIHANRDQTWNYCILACDSCVGVATRLGTPYRIPQRRVLLSVWFSVFVTHDPLKVGLLARDLPWHDRIYPNLWVLWHSMRLHCVGVYSIGLESWNGAVCSSNTLPFWLYNSI